MKELSLEKLENLEGGKMFGTTCDAPVAIGAGKCLTRCKTRFFWIVVDRSPSINPC